MKIPHNQLLGRTGLIIIQIVPIHTHYTVLGQPRGGWKRGPVTIFSGHIIHGRIAESFASNVSRRESSPVIFV